MVLIISPLYYSSFDNNLLILTQGSKQQSYEGAQFCDFMASWVFSKDLKQFDVFGTSWRFLLLLIITQGSNRGEERFERAQR